MDRGNFDLFQEEYGKRPYIPGRNTYLDTFTLAVQSFGGKSGEKSVTCGAALIRPNKLHGYKQVDET